MLDAGWLAALDQHSANSIGHPWSWIASTLPK
jgi:hypothetical protein